MHFLEEKPLVRSVLALGIAIGLGFGVGFARRSFHEKNDKPVTQEKLKFYSPVLARGSMRGLHFVGEVTHSTWSQMSHDERMKAATDLSIRLIDTDHVPSAVVFDGEKVAIEITLATARLVE